MGERSLRLGVSERSLSRGGPRPFSGGGVGEGEVGCVRREECEKRGTELSAPACGRTLGPWRQGGNWRGWAWHSQDWGSVPPSSRRNKDEYDSSPGSGGRSGGSGGCPPLRFHPQDRGRTLGCVLQVSSGAVSLGSGVG